MNYVDFQSFVYKLTVLNRLKSRVIKTSINVKVKYFGGFVGTYCIQSTEEFLELFDIMWQVSGLLSVEVFTPRKNIVWYNLNYN